MLCAKEFSIIFAAGLRNARMAELVDALDSKSSDSNIVPVRFRLRVQKEPLDLQTVKRLFVFCRLSSAKQLMSF